MALQQLSSATPSSVQISSAQFKSVQFSSIQLTPIQPKSAQFNSIHFNSTQFSSALPSEFNSTQFRLLVQLIQLSSAHFSSLQAHFRSSFQTQFSSLFMIVYENRTFAFLFDLGIIWGPCKHQKSMVFDGFAMVRYVVEAQSPEGLSFKFLGEGCFM